MGDPEPAAPRTGRPGRLHPEQRTRVHECERLESRAQPSAVEQRARAGGGSLPTRVHRPRRSIVQGQLGRHGGEAAAGDHPGECGDRRVDGRTARKRPGGVLGEVGLLERGDEGPFCSVVARGGERVQAEHPGEGVAGVEEVDQHALDPPIRRGGAAKELGGGDRRQDLAGREDVQLSGHVDRQGRAE